MPSLFQRVLKRLNEPAWSSSPPQGSSSVRANRFTSQGYGVVANEKGIARPSEIGASDPLAIYRAGASKPIPADKAMAANTGWVYCATNVIGDEVAGMEFKLFQVKPDGTPEEQHDHELLDLLDGANDFQTGPEIKHTIAVHIKLTGNAYLLLGGVRNATDRPTSIFTLDPSGVRVVYDRSDYPWTIVGYEFTVQGRKYRYKPYEIVHIKAPDPSDPYEGTGVVQQIAAWVDLHNYALEFNRQYFIHGIQFGEKFESDATDDATIERLNASLEAGHQGVENAHRATIFPKGVKSLGAAKARDADYSSLFDLTRDMILAGFRVGKTILGTAESDTNRACYDSETEVLTERGWKRYFDVQPGERIAEYDGERNVIRFAEPVRSYVYPYQGPMVHFQNCKMDIMVTPDHRMWYRTDRAKKAYRIGLAGELPNICYFKSAAPVEDGDGLDHRDVDTFRLPVYRKGSHPEKLLREFRMDDWLEFLGYVISEGGVSSQVRNRVITLYQKKQPHTNKIRACLARLKAHGSLNYGEYPDNEDPLGTRFNVYGAPVVFWMHEFIGSYANDKKLPDFVWGLCLRQRKILFDALMLGDGSIDKRDNRTCGYYSTTSHQLADDFQRLALSLGIESHVGVHYEANGNRNTCYRVMLDFGTAEVQMDDTHRHMKSVEQYDGYVWCFKTSTGLFVTRRNGKVALQGNTAETADYVFAKRTIKPLMQMIVSYLNEFLVPRYGDDLYIGFLDPTPEDKSFRIQEMAATMGGQPVLSLNEARERFQGVGPVEGGDTVKVMNTFADLGAPAAEEHPGADNVKGKSRRRTPKTRHARNAEFRRKLSDSIAERVAERLAAARAKKVSELTHGEYDVLIKRLAEKATRYGDAAAAAVREQNAAQREQVLASLAKLFKKSGKFRIPALFDAAAAASTMKASISPILVSLAQEQAPEAASVVGSATVSPETVSALARAIDAGVQLMAESYQQTTLDQLKEKLAEGIEAGDGYAAAAEVVAQVYDFADEVRAEVVARTETNRAFNAANRATWRSLGVRTLTWHTSEQGNVCPFCASLDGVEVGADANFFDRGATLTLGSGQSMALGYSDVPAPPLHPLCNCFVRPGDVGDPS